MGISARKVAYCGLQMDRPDARSRHREQL